MTNRGHPYWGPSGGATTPEQEVWMIQQKKKKNLMKREWNQGVYLICTGIQGKSRHRAKKMKIGLIRPLSRRFSTVKRRKKSFPGRYLLPWVGNSRASTLKSRGGMHEYLILTGSRGLRPLKKVKIRSFSLNFAPEQGLEEKN